MITRKHQEISPAAAKSHLKKYGWSYRSAAPVLGISFFHLSQVLNGHRQSRRLLNAIMELTERKHTQN